MLAAILRNVQLRLEDSNNQSVELAKQIEVILRLVKTQKETNRAVEEKIRANDVKHSGKEPLNQPPFAPTRLSPRQETQSIAHYINSTIDFIRQNGGFRT